MKAVIAVYRGDQEEKGAVALGELARLDDTYSVRLLGFDVESLDAYPVLGDANGDGSTDCRTCGEGINTTSLGELLAFALEHDARHS